MSEEKLYPYQLQGASFLSSKKYALLADEMGLGKTIQTIRALDDINAMKVLIICPTSARYNWEEEFHEWQKTPRSTNQIQYLIDIPTTDNVQIVSFNYVTENYKILNKIKWDVVVVDEAHFAKSFAASRTRAIMGKEGVIRHAKRAWFLSGTPMPNDPSELWVLLYTLGVTRDNYHVFVKKFCITRQTSYGLKIEGANKIAMPALKGMLKQIMLRRKKVDVEIQLPKIRYYRHYVEPGEIDLEITMGFAQYYFPKNREHELNLRLNKESEKLRAMVENINARQTSDQQLGAALSIEQSVSAIRRVIGLKKVDGAVHHIKEKFRVRKIKKIVVFAIHRDVIESLRVKLKDFNPVTLYGGTSAKTRERNIKRFQTTEKYKIFIGNILAAGTAIDLTVAHDVVFVEQDWVPGNNAQAVMRCHRIGQKENVTVSFLALADSIDARLMQIIARKTKDITEIMDVD